MQEINTFEVRTDLAIESRDMYVEQEKEKGDIEGVIVKEKDIKGLQVTYVHITEQGEQKIGKKKGNYVTIYTEGVKKQDTKTEENTAKVLSEELRKLLKINDISKEATGLIVGLGNKNITPDALGPLTTDKILVTSHLFHLQYETVEEGYRPVATITPGVMGVTGIETSEIVLGVINNFSPDFVIAVDALASRSIERLNSTIQISDTGIHPGSGVGNKRKELSKETLGIPVIAIGVPTVVDAVTIASDTIDFLLKHLGKELKEKDKSYQSLLPSSFSFGSKKLTEKDMPNEKQRKVFLGMIGTLSEDEKRSLIESVLSPMGHNFIVTPKEVDAFMEDMGHLLAAGINSALHENVTTEGMFSYTK